MTNSVYIVGGKALSAGGIVTQPVNNPLSLPLAPSVASLLSHLGSFPVPSDFQYGGGGAAVSGTSLYISGNQSSNATVGLMTIPTVPQIIAGGHAASTVVIPKVSSAAVGQATSGSNSILCGSLLYGGFLYSALGIFYNGADAQTSVFIRSPTNLSSVGSTPSPVSFGALGLKQSQFPGQMGLVPSMWQPYFGGPAYIASGLGLGITSTLCVGFGLSTFDPANIDNAGSTVPLTVWQNYPEGAAQNAGFNSSSLWNRTNVTGGSVGTTLTITSIDIAGTVINSGATVTWSGGSRTISSLGSGIGGTGTYNLNSSATITAGTPIWISNTAVAPQSGASTGGDDLASTYDGPLAIALWGTNHRTLAFINAHHFGPEAGPGGLNCDSGASSSNDPRRVQITLYDLAEIYANIQSAGNIYAVTPYAWEEFPNWQSLFGSCPGLPSPGCVNGFMCFDPSNNVLYGNAAGFGGSNWTLDAWSLSGF